MQELEDNYRDNTTSFLSRVTDNIAHMSNLYIHYSYRNLEIAADFISDQLDMNLIDALESTSRMFDSNYLYVGIITASKDVYLLNKDGKQRNINPADMQSILEHQKFISSIIKSFDMHEDIHMMSAPIIKRGEQLGELFVLREHTLLDGMLNAQGINLHCDFYLLDQAGTIISFGGPIVEKNQKNLNDLEKIYFSDALNRANLKIPSSNNQTELAVIKFNQGEFYIDFASLPDLGWTLAALLPTKRVQSRVYTTIFTILGTLGIWIVLFVGMAGYLIYMQRKLHAVAHAKVDELQQTINTIPCAIVRCMKDEKLTIIDYTDSLTEMICATHDDIHKIYHNSWLELIYPDDIEQAMSFLEQKGTDVVTAEYRLLRKNKKPIYIMDRARLVHDELGSWFWCVILDIDDLKKSQLQERNVVERYKKILEMSDNMLYEYDLRSHKLSISSQFFENFNYPMPAVGNRGHYPVNRDIVHPDDLDLFMSMQMRIKVGGRMATALLRIKTYQGQWLWCQLRQTAWTDENGMLKAIGKIENVDKETRILHKLKDDVQRDSFTSLYNKKATEELVQRELNLTSEERGAFCIIDIDNFKQVNSVFGHAMGDMVIKNLADGLAQTFRSDDIVGRIGGDEFIVYLKDMVNLRPLLSKIDSIQDFFRQTFEDGDTKLAISCSIGIALFPKDGTNYAELYRNADKALYRSKIKKDTYNFYDEKIDS